MIEDQQSLFIKCHHYVNILFGNPLKKTRTFLQRILTLKLVVVCTYREFSHWVMELWDHWVEWVTGFQELMVEAELEWRHQMVVGHHNCEGKL